MATLGGSFKSFKKLKSSSEFVFWIEFETSQSPVGYNALRKENKPDLENLKIKFKSG